MSLKIKPGNIFIKGVHPTDNGMNFTFELGETGAEKCTLHLYKKIKDEPDFSVDMPESNVAKGLRSILISGLSEDFIAYRICNGSEELSDSRATGLIHPKGYARHGIHDKIYYRLPGASTFDWEQDENPKLEGSDVIAYKLHVRGFTATFKTEDAGSFRALMNQIPYLKSLGVNQIELMPAYDFDEVEYLPVYEGSKASSALPLRPKRLLNYWGYKKAHYFAVKSAYSVSESPMNEFKALVKELHKNGMELIMEFYFPSEYPVSDILDALRFYFYEYHIDGVHILSGGELNEALKREAFFVGKKLYLEYSHRELPELYHYNDGFLADTRRFVKGDDAVLRSVLSYFMLEGANRVNYFANHNGFSLADCFAYDRKHNEKNGFDNTDGTDFNYTWNCGKEGASRSKKISALRTKQIKNALFLTLTARGIPLIHAGDEMGKTKKGNNNSFCQDNLLSYVEWEDLKKNGEIFDFFKACTEFRRKHPILSCKKEKLENVSNTGWPLVSFHSDKAWDFKFRSYDKAVGILFNGEYYRDLEHRSDDLIYLGFNMHYEKVNLALPILPKDRAWVMKLDSSGSCAINGGSLEMTERSAVALVAERTGRTKKSENGNKKRNSL